MWPVAAVNFNIYKRYALCKVKSFQSPCVDLGCMHTCRRSLVAQETDGGWRARIQKTVNLWQQLETESCRQSGSRPAVRRTDRPLCLCFPTGLPSVRSCRWHSRICTSVLQPRRRQITFVRVACKSRGRPSSLFCRRCHCRRRGCADLPVSHSSRRKEREESVIFHTV